MTTEVIWCIIEYKEKLGHYPNPHCWCLPSVLFLTFTPSVKVARLHTYFVAGASHDASVDFLLFSKCLRLTESLICLESKLQLVYERQSSFTKGLIITSIALQFIWNLMKTSTMSMVYLMSYGQFPHLSMQSPKQLSIFSVAYCYLL